MKWLCPVSVQVFCATKLHSCIKLERGYGQKGNFFCPADSLLLSYIYPSWTDGTEETQILWPLLRCGQYLLDNTKQPPSVFSFLLSHLSIYHKHMMTIANRRDRRNYSSVPRITSLMQHCVMAHNSLARFGTEPFQINLLPTSSLLLSAASTPTTPHRAPTDREPMQMSIESHWPAEPFRMILK